MVGWCMHAKPEGCASLPCRMENAMGYGTHITPSGLDFDEHSWYLGGGTSLRTGASVNWPRQIPIPPGVGPPPPRPPSHLSLWPVACSNDPGLSCEPHSALCQSGPLAAVTEHTLQLPACSGPAPAR